MALYKPVYLLTYFQQINLKTFEFFFEPKPFFFQKKNIIHYVDGEYILN